MDTKDFHVKPGRDTVALSMMQLAYSQAFENYRNQEMKAASVTAWIAAVLAIAMFQTFDAGTHHIAWIKFFAFLFLIVAAFCAVLALPAIPGNKAGIDDPIGVLRQQNIAYWDENCPDGVDPDAFAEAGTQRQLIESVNDAIVELRRNTAYKEKMVFWSFKFFLAAILMLGVYALSPMF